MNSTDLDSLEAKLKADLTAIQRVRELLSSGAFPTESANSVAATPSVNAEEKTQQIVVSGEPTAFGEVTNAVSATVKSLKAGFTIVDVEGMLSVDGKNYVRSSIRGALARLERQGKIRIDRQGEGRRPTTYDVPEDATKSVTEEF